MTEQEWLVSANPESLLSYLSGDNSQTAYTGEYDPPRVSDRKFRLFALACWRTIPPDHITEGWLEALEQLEEVAEGKRKSFAKTVEGYICATRDVGDMLRWLSGLWSGSNIEGVERQRRSEVCTNILREVVGNPFYPLKINPDWLCPQTTVGLANAIYKDRTFDSVDMLVLADMLHDRGCEDEEILRHLRGYVPAPPGWFYCPMCDKEWKPIHKYDDCDGGAACEGLAQPARWIRKPVACFRGCYVVDAILERI